MESLFGLPAHPLLVHAPVVIVPLLALATAALVVRPQWRRGSGLVWLGAAVVAFVSTFLANQSGEAFNDVLEDRIGTLAERHEELGNQTTLLVFLFLLSVFASVVAERRRSDSRLASVLAVVAAVLGLIATAWMVRTGHEGARIVWDGVIPS